MADRICFYVFCFVLRKLQAENHEIDLCIDAAAVHSCLAIWGDMAKPVPTFNFLLKCFQWLRKFSVFVCARIWEVSRDELPVCIGLAEAILNADTSSLFTERKWIGRLPCDSCNCCCDCCNNKVLKQVSMSLGPVDLHSKGWQLRQLLHPFDFCIPQVFEPLRAPWQQHSQKLADWKLHMQWLLWCFAITILAKSMLFVLSKASH